MQLIIGGADANRGIFTMANKCLFADLLLFESGERDEVTSPSLCTLRTSRLMLPARRWKRPMQLITCGADANRGVFTTANK